MGCWTITAPGDANLAPRGLRTCCSSSTGRAWPSQAAIVELGVLSDRHRRPRQRAHQHQRIQGTAYARGNERDRRQAATSAPDYGSNEHANGNPDAGSHEHTDAGSNGARHGPRVAATSTPSPAATSTRRRRQAGSRPSPSTMRANPRHTERSIPDRRHQLGLGQVVRERPVGCVRDQEHLVQWRQQHIQDLRVRCSAQDREHPGLQRRRRLEHHQLRLPR